jgi:hypothetical protein
MKLVCLLMTIKYCTLKNQKFKGLCNRKLLPFLAVVKLEVELIMRCYLDYRLYISKKKV